MSVLQWTVLENVAAVVQLSDMTEGSLPPVDHLDDAQLKRVVTKAVKKVKSRWEQLAMARNEISKVMTTQLLEWIIRAGVL